MYYLLMYKINVSSKIFILDIYLSLMFKTLLISFFPDRKQISVCNNVKLTNSCPIFIYHPLLFNSLYVYLMYKARMKIKLWIKREFVNLDMPSGIYCVEYLH